MANGDEKGRARWRAGIVCALLLAAAALAVAAEADVPPATDVLAAEDAAGRAAGENAAPDTGPHPPGAAPAAEEEHPPTLAQLCSLASDAARRHGVPHDFFVRLIFQESRFDPHAVSPVGARGIAQFMPYTARERGLHDAFDPAAALPASAAFLAELHERFGNWGLAAAGYNGGPNRVSRWLDGRIGRLPGETIAYVHTITGRTVEEWKGEVEALRLAARTPATIPLPAPAALAVRRAAPRHAADAAAPPADLGPGAPGGRRAANLFAPTRPPLPAPRPAPDRPTIAEAAPAPPVPAPAVPRPRPERTVGPSDCVGLVVMLGTHRVSPRPPGGGAFASGASPWGAQVAGHPKRHVAMRQYERLRGRLPADLRAKAPGIVVRRFAARGRMPIHAVQFAADSRTAAAATCRRIAAARLPCVVVRNR